MRLNLPTSYDNREVSLQAKEVHVVDRRLKVKDVEGKGGYERLENVYRRPMLTGFLNDGRSVVGDLIGMERGKKGFGCIGHKIVPCLCPYSQEFEDGSIIQVDAVMLCTGYCYQMPFLEGGIEGSNAWENTKGVSGGARLLHIDDRAVHPTYQHLFHAYWPSLSFMGLLHSVVPFRKSRSLSSSVRSSVTSPLPTIDSLSMSHAIVKTQPCSNSKPNGSWKSFLVTPSFLLEASASHG